MGNNDRFPLLPQTVHLDDDVIGHWWSSGTDATHAPRATDKPAKSE